MFNEEKIFLASLMRDPTAVLRLESEVTQYDFINDLHYDFYSSIMEFLVEDKTPTYSDLRFKFKKDQRLTKLVNEVENESLISLDLKEVYDEMIEVTQKLRVKKLAELVTRQCNTDKDSTSIISSIENELLNISSRSNMELRSISKIIPSIVIDLKDKVKKYRASGTISGTIKNPTGLRRLDEETLGFTTQTMWCLAASTSDGKTQLATQFCNNMMKKGKKVFYFMLEDAEHRLIHRFLSLRNGVAIRNIQIGNVSDIEERRITNDLQELGRDDNLLIDDHTTEVNEMVAKVKLAKIKNKSLALVVIDYIGLSYDSSRNYNTREQELSFISKKLLNLSKMCDVAILVLSQLNTNPEERARGVPIRMNDLRDSKAPGHDSTVTIFLYHPLKNLHKFRKVSPNVQLDVRGYSNAYSHLIIAKNRYGEANKIIELTNRGHLCRFEEGKPSGMKSSISDYIL